MTLEGRRAVLREGKSPSDHKFCPTWFADGTTSGICGHLYFEELGGIAIMCGFPDIEHEAALAPQEGAEK